MPEVEDPVGLADEPRSVDDVGLALQDGRWSAGIVLRVVFEVGVLDDDDLAGGVAEAGANRGSLAGVSLVEDDRDAVTRLQHSRAPSVDPSSITTISASTSAAAIRRKTSAMVCTSLNAGITIDTFIVPSHGTSRDGSTRSPGARSTATEKVQAGGGERSRGASSRTGTTPSTCPSGSACPASSPASAGSAPMTVGSRWPPTI